MFFSFKRPLPLVLKKNNEYNLPSLADGGYSQFGRKNLVLVLNIPSYKVFLPRILIICSWIIKTLEGILMFTHDVFSKLMASRPS